MATTGHAERLSGSGPEADITEQLDAVSSRLGPYFSRAEPRRRVGAYLRGLLAPVGRKTGRQLAGFLGDAHPYGVQHLLGRAGWDADAVRDELRAYVVERLGDPGAVLVVDETDFPKRGLKSVGVQRQYSETLGRVANCQVGVFLGYATTGGGALLDRELYLPQSWAGDLDRRAGARVPEPVRFATKPELARRVIERNHRAGVPAAWVMADAVYGSELAFRAAVERLGLGYVVGVRSDEPVALGFRQRSAAAQADGWTATAWQVLPTPDPQQGARLDAWAVGPLNSPEPETYVRRLLVRSDVNRPADRSYYLCGGPAGTSLETWVRIASTRSTLGAVLNEARAECGLDDYEVRSWPGWYRHVTLAMLAQAVRVAACAGAKRPD